MKQISLLQISTLCLEGFVTDLNQFHFSPFPLLIPGRKVLQYEQEILSQVKRQPVLPLPEAGRLRIAPHCQLGL